MPAQKKRQLRGFVYSLLRSLSLTSHCTAQQTNEGQFYGFIVLQTAEHTWNEERMMTDGNWWRNRGHTSSKTNEGE